MIVGTFTYIIATQTNTEPLDVPCQPFQPEDVIAKDRAESLYNEVLTEQWDILLRRGAIEIHYVEIEPNPFF